MSKGNMFLGLARGSVGDVTFYRRNAQQITRVRVRNVKNPQSPAQMGQRAIQRTAVQAYKVLKEICNHSFENVSYGANSYAKFLSLNMDMLRYEAAHPDAQMGNKAFCPAGFEGMAAMPYVIAKGSLPSVGGDIISYSSGQTIWEGIELINWVGNPDSCTYQQFIERLGARQGDQLTIIRVPNPVDFGFPEEPLARNMILARIILDPGSGNDPAETAFFDTSSAHLRINDPNPRNEGVVQFNIIEGLVYGTALTQVGDATNRANFGFAAILSRQKEDGSWLRSDSILKLGEGWREDGYTLKQASTLEPVEVYVENDYYLNNAE